MSVAIAPIIPLGTRRDSDAELVGRALRGDAWAHEALYRQYVGLVATVARRMLQPSDVDDVVQETFLIAFEKLDRLTQPEALKGWLLRIAVSQVHRRFRFWRVKKWVLGDVGHAALADQVAPGAPANVTAELAKIDCVLATLSPKLREPWILRCIVGCSLDEVATACDCSLATTKRRIREAQDAVDTFTGARS
jgi:RNA polymerase sigma-70 factor (ECF subfamily)